MKLDVGCGLRPMTEEGWETLDIRENIPMFDHSTYHPDIVADILKGIPRNDETYEHVRLSSVLEHFDRDEGLLVLRECFRVLSPGGTIFVSVPDMLAVAKSLVNSETLNIREMTKDMMTLTYGAQTYEENYHKWGYTVRTLTVTMKEIGFTKITRLPSRQYAQELAVEGEK